MTSADYSADFYRHHAHQYAKVALEWRQSVYIKSSHPALKNDWDAWEPLRQLTPGNRGLNLGCGAGARDVFHLWSQGYDVVGLDAIEENIQVVHQLHPEIAALVFVASLAEVLPFDDGSFDFGLDGAAGGQQKSYQAVGSSRGCAG